jgi:hypothetical protein
MSEMSDFKKNYFKHLEEEVTAILKKIKILYLYLSTLHNQRILI